MCTIIWNRVRKRETVKQSQTEEGWTEDKTKKQIYEEEEQSL